MRDINNPLIKAYYDAILPLGYPVYEGEEPDNTTSEMYIVISDVSSNDTSTKSSSDVNAQIQVTINSRKVKYNNSKDLNIVAGEVLEAINPTPQSTLSAATVNIVTTKLTNDVTNNYGKLAGSVFISRNLIFSHLINY